MSMVPNPDPGLTFFTVEDFRPGIISQANFGYGVVDNQAPVPVTGLGPTAAAAQPVGTSGCIALPSGGLAPLPQRQATSMPPPGIIINGDTTWITGMTTFGRVSTPNGPSDEIVYGLEYINGGNRIQYVIVLDPQGTYNAAIVTNGPAASVNNSGTYALTGALTMANAVDPTGAATGSAELVLATAFINDAAPIGADSHLYMYPDPYDLGGSVAPYDFAADLPSGQAVGVVLGHQNRIVILQQNEYLWTNASPGKVLAGEFEHFYYTDPPNTIPGNGNPDSLAQNEVFVQEWPVGVGTYGSISAGELFLVKHSGGGFIVSGDLNNPTITWLGGVTPTYGANTTCASSPIGIAYLSNNNGLYVWNGSNTSQKLSGNLNDDFWAVPQPPPSIGPTCNVASWGQWIVAPNNYLYDITTQGWWKLDNQTVPFSWYATSWDGNTLYAMPSNVSGPNASTLPTVYQFSRSVPAPSFSWRSYPIPKSVNRTIEIQEVAVRAQGNGTVVLNFTGTNGTSQNTNPFTLTLDAANQPQLIRADLAPQQAQDVTVTIMSTGTAGGPAPVVYGFSVGFLETTPVNPI
jgi:hypothetical protein